MTILRQGGKYTLYIKAKNYLRHHDSEFDIVVDEINTVPFWTPRFVKDAHVMALIHQLARQIWFYETGFPVNVLGYFALEPLWLRTYRQVPTITVSQSTKSDLERRGFQHVFTVHNGLGIQPLPSVPEKTQSPVLIFVGRLVRSKRPDHAVEAFNFVRKKYPTAELWILGDGYMRRKLFDENEGVRCFGRVSEIQKFDLLRKANVLLVPSIREGWGVSVIEANAMGTPSVGYDVEGLRDSIIQGVTGLRVQSNPRALAEGTLRILDDFAMSKTLSTNALAWSRNFSWDQTGREFEALLQSSLAGNLS